VLPVAQVDRFQDLVDAGAAGASVEAGEQLQVLAAGQPGVELRALDEPGDPVQRLSIVFAALAISHWIEARTGWSIRKFVSTARRYRTIEIQAGGHTITAADPLPNDLRNALQAIHRPAHQFEPSRGCRTTTGHACSPSRTAR